MKILVVDDDRAVLDTQAHLLHKIGYTVTKADDGASALFAIEHRGPFDLILTDYSMPGMNGVELSLKVRAATPEQRIVICTASYTLEATLPTFGLEDIPVLLKPVDPPTLFAFLLRIGVKPVHTAQA